MVKRMVLMLTVTLIFIGALGFVKFQQVQAAIARGAAFTPPPAAVTTIVASQEEWPATLSAIGTMAAVQGVMVSADLPGIVDRINFASGRAVREGDVLAELDTRQERAQLAAIEAERELARLNYERMKGLLSDRVVSQADFDRAMAEEKQTTAQVGEVQATIERKTIRAAFSGVLGIRLINLGQFLGAGDPVVPLQSLDPIYVNFGVPQQEIPRIRVGNRVTVRADDRTYTLIGQVTAVDSIVDEATRNVQVQATLSNATGDTAPWHVRSDTAVTGVQSRRHHAAGIRDQLRTLWRFGVHCHRPQKRERPELSRCAPAIRQAGRGAWRSDCGDFRRHAG